MRVRQREFQELAGAIRCHYQRTTGFMRDLFCSRVRWADSVIAKNGGKLADGEAEQERFSVFGAWRLSRVVEDICSLSFAVGDEPP